MLSSIPLISLDQVLGEHQAELRLTVKAYEDGMLPVNEAVVLLSLLVVAKPKVVLEIGTFYGFTSKAMAVNLPDAVIHTVDLPVDFDPAVDQVSIPKDCFHLIAKRKVGREFVGTEVAARIRQHFHDTATWDFQEAKGATFFFIDGSHTYEYCKSDSEKCLELCQGRGIFLWHDCNADHPGVVRFIAEWRGLGRNIFRFENTSLAFWVSV